MPFDLRLVLGDLVVDPFDLQLNVAGLEAVAQRLTISLNAFKGEFFLNTQFGVPYYQVIFRKGSSSQVVDNELRKVILGVEGVLQLQEYNSSIDAGLRALSVTFRARVQDGIIDADLSLGAGAPCIYIAPAGGSVALIQTGPLTPQQSAEGLNMNFDCE